MNRILVLFLTAFLISGCVTLKDPETSQEFRANDVATIKPDQVFTQTFVSRRSNLTQIQIWLRISDPESVNGQNLVFELYQDQNCRVLVNKQAIPFEKVKDSSPLTVSFDPIAAPPSQIYCYRLSLSEGESIVLGRNEDQYPHGEAFLNDYPLDSDSAFRTGYNYDFHLFIADILTWIKKIFIFIPFILTLWLPGRFLLYLTNLDKKFDWGERTAISFAVSLSIIAVLLLWSSFLGFSWTQAVIEIGFFLLIITFFFMWLIRSLVLMKHQISKQNKDVETRTPGCLRNCFKDALKFIRYKNVQFERTPSLINLSLFSIFIVTLITRFIMVRDFSAPAWVDSIHHALISQFILTNGVYPQSYAPFIDINTASYHAGFHSSFAVFQWLSGWSLTQGLLFYGQVLNAAMVFSVYAFTTSLVKDRSAGLLAALVAGIFSPMPAYYTSWGRYTQLAGLMIFTVVFSLSLNYVEAIPEGLKAQGKSKIKAQFPMLLITGILWAGLMLTHYRIVVFAIALWLAYIFIQLITSVIKKEKILKIIPMLVVPLITFLSGILLSLPWWPETISSLFLPSLSWMNNPPTSPFSGFSWTLLTSSMGTYILILATLGFFWATFQKKMFQWVLIVWVILLFFMANLSVWGLPGSNFINNLSVTITLFIPISVMCGFVLGWAISGWVKLSRLKGKFFVTSIIILILILLSFIGVRSTLGLTNPTTVLFRQADDNGIAWVTKYIPQNQTILVNPFSWGYGVYAGSDGGYWISPISKTPTIPPAVLYGLNAFSAQSYSEISQNVIQLSNNPEGLFDYLKEQDIHYIFIGAKGGVLSPKLLISSGLFTVLYNQNGVWLFKINA